MKAADLFAGAGGFSTGARLAGVTVVWAANHWPAAVRVHERNHPATIHACQDLQQANWATVPAHDLLLASPCCPGATRMPCTCWVTRCAHLSRPMSSTH